MSSVTLHLGDCLDVLKTMPDGCVDAVVTDPPYGTKKTSWDESVSDDLFAECVRVAKHYAVFFYSNTRLWHILAAIRATGCDSWVAVWHKSNAMGFERRFAPQWVPIVVAYKGNPPFWGQDFHHCPIVPQKHGHPTPKPIGVTRWVTEKASPEGGTVLDPFMGSGTTGVACVQTGRNFIGIEIDPTYYATARRRIAEAQAACPLFAEASP